MSGASSAARLVPRPSCAIQAASGTPVDMRTISRAMLVVVTLVLLAAPARAAQYPARSDTDWVYASKRACCDGAIALAQQHSAEACQISGGRPSPMRGGVQRRGFCTWQSTQDASGAILFRCQAEATVPCR